MKLVIGNKAYSSWSLRAWIVLKTLAVDFEEVMIPLDTKTTAESILKLSPSGKVPSLIDGDITIWDTMAIVEYLNEKFPAKNLWPADTKLRTFARSACAEMHSGFINLRKEMPANFLTQKKGIDPSDKAKFDIKRVVQILQGALHLSQSKSWLLGKDFGIIDAFFAPVVGGRFHTYLVKLPSELEDYKQRLLQYPAYKLWCEQAKQEKEVVTSSEIGTPV